ncbi:MAG: hypothetical protein SPG48_06240 [Treponema sp.]|nr:hypothetical protein [Treponema sp.]
MEANITKVQITEDEGKKYNFFVKSTAEFDAFADFEPITNLTAEEAVRTLIELNIKKGLSAGIGINIPDDFIFDDPDGNGAIIFMKTNDEYSFYMGDNFIKELKENNEHAQNVIAAFKELDNVIKTSVLGDIEVYKKPDFLYAKEKELFGDNKQENISETEIEEEKQIIQKRIQWLKNSLEHPDENNPDDEQYVSETKEYINRLENMSDDEIRNLVIWKKETQKKNEEIHKQVVEQMKKEKERKNTPQNGELLSYNETHPIYSLINKETGRQIVIQPSGKVEDNVKELGRLKNLTEAKEAIEKIKATGFNMYSTESRIVLFNDDKFYDFDKFADSGRFNFRTEQLEYNRDNRNLKDWDFKYYIDHGFKITKQMKDFEKIRLYDNTPLAGLTEEEVGEICFGLWEAEDKGLLDYEEKVFHSGPYPAYPGDKFVTEYLLDNQNEYNFAELKEQFLSKEEHEVQISPVTLEEILGVMEMRPEVTPEGKIKVFDLQRQEYIDNRSDLPPFDEDNWTFSNASEIFERLDVYINDYYVHDMQEQLEEAGIEITGDETLANLCSLYKTELENGNENLSLGELNLAMGIVEPDTVIMFENERKLEINQEKEENYSLSNEEWRACDVLAEKAKMDWWFEEYGSDGDIHKDVSKEDLNDLSTAFDGYMTIDEKYRQPIKELFKRANIEFNDITLLSTQEISSRAENLYGFYFEYNDDEKCSDIYRSEDGDFVGSYSDGGFGYADGIGIDVPKIPDEVFQDVIALSRQFYIESEEENERNMDSFVRHTIIDEQKIDFLESPKVFNTPKSLGLSESEQFAYYQYELSLNQIKTIVSAESDIVKKVEENTDSPEHLDIHFVFDREHNKLSDFYIRYNKNNNTYTSSYVAGEVRESDISKNMQENLCKIFEGVFKMNQEIQTGAEEVQAVSLSDLPVEELREGLKYALNEVAQPLPEIDFTRENYNKLFPRDRLKTPIETVKIGAHQFEKLEVKDRKKLLQAVHDVLSTPDVIINEEKESIFGDTENAHVYAKSYVINEKTKAVQSVVVNIEDEYISISTHKRDISNVVNKIKKPDQLLFAAAKVRLLAEQHTKEKLSQSVVSPNRENEYVIPPQTNIPQSQEKSSDENKIDSEAEVSEKPELKTYHTLKEEDVKNLEIISDEDFSDIVDSIILNDYKNIPNTIRLPNINLELAEKLGLEKDSAFIMKKSATHIRPDRKGSYGQAFDTEEYRMIPKVLREANFAVADNVFKNFQIVFDDENNPEKINKLIFNKDELGNYLVTIGKVDRESAFSEERNAVVAVGVAPTIQTLRTRASSTALRASATTVNSNIPQTQEKSSDEISQNFFTIDKQGHDVLEQCNKILDKYSNTHFTELEQRYINECETKNDDRHQVLMSLCNMKYIHCTTKDKNGYWEINKGKEITANEARKLMSYDDFASGLDRASFHLTAGRNANDGSFVYFNDSERKRDIQPYELTKEDYLLLSQYEKAGGSTEIIPEVILQQLSQYNTNINNENPKVLSWQEIEDYFSARNVRETKNEVLESFTESQEKPAEKELKEECVARLLENQIDFYGFDTNKTDDKLNSEISVAKWDVLEKIAEKTVSKELDLKPYAIIQEEADKLLMENPVFQECIKNGIISEPDFLLKTENKKDIELTAEDIKNAKALLPKEQYQLILGYTQGEEGEHFKGIIKEISSKAEAIKGKREILTEDEKHPLAFKYIMGASSFYFSEWDGGDELYGYVVLNGNAQDSEWGYTSLEELKNSSSKDRNGFPVIPEMIFYGLEDTIEKQISVDYPELTEQMEIKPKLNHNEELISEFGKEIFETLQSRKLEQSAYNICCAAQFVIRTMDSSEQKEIFSIMKKCGCEGKNGKENTEDFLTEVVRAENNTASSAYDRKRLYEKINKACPPKKAEAGKGIHNQENDYEKEI